MVVQAKGHRSIRITKVKGHVSQAQVDQGIYRAVDKVGNDKADLAADLATGLHGQDVIAAAKIFHERSERYVTFMKNVAMHIVEAYLIHRKLVRIKEEKEGKASKQQGVSYHPLQMHTPATSRLQLSNLQVQGYPVRFKAFHSKHASCDAVWAFLGDLTIVESHDHANATTWLELYLLYRLRGNPKPILDNKFKARSRATVQMQLREFKNVVRGVVDRAIYDDKHKGFFKPAKVTQEKFLCLGLRGKHAAINGSVLVDDEIAQHIEHYLITLGHRVSTAHVSKFKQGEANFMPVAPNLNGRVGWDSNIKAIVKQGPSPYNAHCPGNVFVPASSPVCFQCPACSASELSTTRAFQLVDLDLTCKCKSCEKISKSKDWRCGCNIPWHLCNMHQSNANCTITNPPSSGPTGKRKAMVGPFSQELLQQIDAKRMRKAKRAILPPAPNILSAELKERFAHLFTEVG